MSFTWISRARNSGSYAYHAVAATFSNGLWFITQFILIDNFVQIAKNSDWRFGITLGLTYVAGTVSGSVFMHYLSVEYLERGKRIVGAK